MDSIRVVVYLSVCLSVATAILSSRSEDPQEPQEPYYHFSSNDLSELLEGHGLSAEKRGSLIPRCDVGERCAMKHGPRIGRLCDCLRGAACNSFFLRCY